MRLGRGATSGKDAIVVVVVVVKNEEQRRATKAEVRAD